MISLNSLNHALNGKFHHQAQYCQQTKSLIKILLKQSGLTENQISNISLDAIDNFTNIVRLDCFAQELQDFVKLIKKHKAITLSQRYASLSRIIENANEFTTVILEEMASLTKIQRERAATLENKFLAARQERLVAQTAAAKAVQHAQEAEQRAHEAGKGHLAAEAELAKFKKMYAETQQSSYTATGNMPADTPATAQTTCSQLPSSRAKLQLPSLTEASASTASNPNRVLAQADTIAAKLPDAKKAKIDKPGKKSTSAPSSPLPRKQ